MKSPNTQDAPATPPLPEQNGSQSPWSEGQKIDTCDSEENNGPVQETCPAQQTQVDHLVESRYSFSLYIPHKTREISVNSLSVSR